jgi:hypothetical protein
MNKYTETDYRNTHKGIVEDMVDTLIKEWHESTCPLKARVCRNLASELEALRETKVENINVWVSAANEERENKPAMFADTRSKS